MWEEWAVLLRDAGVVSLPCVRYLIGPVSEDFEYAVDADNLARAREVLRSAQDRVAHWGTPLRKLEEDDGPERDELAALMEDAPRASYRRGRASVLALGTAHAKKNKRTHEPRGRPPIGTRDFAEAQKLLLGYCPGPTIKELRACIRRGRLPASLLATRTGLDYAIYRLLECDRSVASSALAVVLECSVSTVYKRRDAGAAASLAAAA